jgi:hypothetical protein
VISCHFSSSAGYTAQCLNFTGKEIPVDSPAAAGDCLFPTIRVRQMTVEANFGENAAKPFKFDIKKFPGLEFE